MPGEQELRSTTEAFLELVERLHQLERRKQELSPGGGAELLAVSHDVEELTRELLESAKRETELAMLAAKRRPAGVTPIAKATPRDLHLILDEWREADRTMAAQRPGTPSWESARADVERLREEYARAYQAREE